MKTNFVGNIIFLLLIIIIGLAVAIYLGPFIPAIEGFYSYMSPVSNNFPQALDKPILNDYPLINKNELSNDGCAQLWWRHPIFSLPSFKQQTNNIRYRYNPDDGSCTPADFCGTLYHDKKVKSNLVYPLPPAQEGPGARVGYFRTEPNELYFSIPTNENILY